MQKLLIITGFFILNSISHLFAQGELDLQPRILYRNERSAAIYLNSNGIGGGYRYGQRITARRQNLYEIDLLSIKHPKEIKISNNIYSNRSFIFGKQNAFFELRAMYGKQNELFRKNDRGGVSVRYFYTGGPALGVLKPIYYEVLYSSSIPFEFSIETRKFSPSVHQSNIYGRASFFKGFDEVKLSPGASIKTGFSFEYSRQDIVMHSLEAGVSLDAFPKKIPIMATTYNNFFFLNLFVSYRFGKYIDISEGAKTAAAKEREERKTNRNIFRNQKRQDNEEHFF